MIEPLRFTVYGTPQPAGSKKAYVRGRHASVVDANPKSRPWKHQVAQVAAEAMDGRELMDGPIRLTLSFVRTRPKSHYTSTGKLSAKGRRSPYPTTRPDALKLARGVEDAMEGVVYRDDAQIVVETLYKEYGSPECVEVKVVPIPVEITLTRIE